MKVKLIIKQIRRKKNISLEELSYKTKIPIIKLINIENGIIEPTFSTVINISKRIRNIYK